MAYEFKNLNAVDMIEETNEFTTVLGVHEGNIVQMPASNMGSNDSKGLIFTINEDDISYTSGGIFINKVYDPIYEAIINGKFVTIHDLSVNEINNVSVKNGEYMPVLNSHLYPYSGLHLWVYSASRESMTELAFSNGSYHESDAPQ